MVVIVVQSASVPKNKQTNKKQKPFIAHVKWLNCTVCAFCLRMQSIVEVAGWWFKSELFPIFWESTDPTLGSYILLWNLPGVSGDSTP